MIFRSGEPSLKRRGEARRRRNNISLPRACAEAQVVKSSAVRCFPSELDVQVINTVTHQWRDYRHSERRREILMRIGRQVYGGRRPSENREE